MEYSTIRYKDCSPKATLEKIESILADCKISTEKLWSQENGYGSSSLRVVIKGTDIGQNGKGINREFALASAMAEFMERLQNNLLFPLHFADETNSAFGFTCYPDEKILSLPDFVEQASPWTLSFEQRNGMEGKNKEEKVKALKKLGCNDCIRLGKDGLLCVPYYSIHQKKIFYLPIQVMLNEHSSNGMCAGNSIQEAFVQGVSEIFERRVQRTLLTSKVSLPNIPDSYIKKYPKLDNMLSGLKKEKGYKFLLKDATIVENYPVAVFIAINLQKGTYGIRFGAHPQYEIAIERSITEAFQGKGLESFSQYSPLEFGNSITNSYTNMFNAYKVGIGVYPPQILLSASEKSFIVPKHIPHDNLSMCNWIINKVAKRGLDILVRNVSYLGFPSLHVVIPGLSEMFPNRMEMFLNRLGNTKEYICLQLKHSQSLTTMDAGHLLNLLDATRNNQIENRLPYIYKLPIAPKAFPFELESAGNLFLSAICCGILGEWEKGAAFLKQISQLYEMKGLMQPVCLNVSIMWFLAKASGKAVSEIIEYCNVVYDNTSVTEIINELMGLEQMKMPFMPQTDCFHCNSCEIKSLCSYKEIERTWLGLKSKMIFFFPNQNDLSDCFGQYANYIPKLLVCDNRQTLVEENAKNMWGEVFQPAEYLEASRIKLLHREFTTVVRDFIGLYPMQKMIEVGCGSGAFISYIEDAVNDMQIYGLDNDAALIKEAKKKEFRRNRVHFIRGDAYKLPFDSDTFDIAASHTFFQCITDKENALLEMKRVVKKGGCIAAIVPMSLQLNVSNPGHYPENATWVGPLRLMETKVDFLIKKQLKLELLSSDNATAYLMPNLFSKVGLSNIRILPLGKAFSLSNAAMPIKDKYYYINNWYLGEVKRFNAMMDFPAFRREMEKDCNSYLQLLQEKHQFWLKHLNDNKIFEWEGNSALLVCGNKTK